MQKQTENLFDLSDLYLRWYSSVCRLRRAMYLIGLDNSNRYDRWISQTMTEMSWLCGIAENMKVAAPTECIIQGSKSRGARATWMNGQVTASQFRGHHQNPWRAWNFPWYFTLPLVIIAINPTPVGQNVKVIWEHQASIVYPRNSGLPVAVQITWNEDITQSIIECIDLWQDHTFQWHANQDGCLLINRVQCLGPGGSMSWPTGVLEVCRC